MALKLIPFDAADFLHDEDSIADYLAACTETGVANIMRSAEQAVARARLKLQVVEQARDDENSGASGSSA